MVCDAAFQSVLLSCLVTMAVTSVGDKSYVYQKCKQSCIQANCTGEKLDMFRSSCQLIPWSCNDECQYTCMWVTVDAFQKDGLPIPQFHGKWPFVRFLGIQEPASMIFSILNGLAHLCIFRYRKYVHKSTPMYYVWHGAALIAINAWTWSTIFHSKDTDFTEKMDYFFAFSVVLYNTFTLVCRVFGTAVKWRPIAIGTCCIIFFIQHISYLTFNKFDYGYNMQINISVAILNMIGWVCWCVKMRHHHYVWQAMVAIVGIQILLLLELYDFAPLWWIFDAHSLWHMGTAPLCLLWYRFVLMFN